MKYFKSDSPKSVTDDQGNIFNLTKTKVAVYSPINPQSVSYYETKWFYGSIKESMKYRSFEIKIIKRYQENWDVVVGQYKFINVVGYASKDVFRKYKTLHTLEDAYKLIDQMQDFFRKKFPKNNGIGLEDTPLGKRLVERNKPLLKYDDMADNIERYMINASTSLNDVVRSVIPSLMNVVEDENLIDEICAEWRLNYSDLK